LSILNDFEREKKIFLNYWKAITTILDDGDSTTLYKYNGVELFCKFSIPFLCETTGPGELYSVDDGQTFAFMLGKR